LELPGWFLKDCGDFEDVVDEGEGEVGNEESLKII
jgi:hypothetical protein